MVQIKYTLLAAGSCSHTERITIKGGKWRPKKYPAICALLEHPQHGKILFDTGYTHRFFNETTKWPFWLYRKITPVQICDTQILSSQLKKLKISPGEINYIILSHFHADHIAGCRDFPNATFICSEVAYEAVRKTKTLRALKKGYLSGLLPDGFDSIVSFVENKRTVDLSSALYPFSRGKDVLGDGSLLSVDLPGHAKGQIGIAFKDPHDTYVFLIADSCWSSQAYKEFKLPSFITYLVHDDKKDYQQTLRKLHQLHNTNKNIRIIPSHCDEVWEQFKEANVA